MDLNKKRKDLKNVSKRDKKLKKLINKSDSDSDESEHELSHYLNDRVKLMKEVLKIIKPKKIKNMAPECMKNLDIEEINSMLLEELLGISNKRLKYIFNGQNLEEDSSSTDPEAEQQPIDLISLDDITDDDFVIDLDSENETYKKRHKRHKPKIKEEGKRKKVKKEKEDKGDQDKPSKKSKDKMNEQNLMSVLELLELQARARAIRSQLALETNKKIEEEEQSKKTVESDNDDAIIIESPKNIEIVITSESEGEDSLKNNSKERTKKKDENNLNSVQGTSAQNKNVFHSEMQNQDDQTRTAITNENIESKRAEDKEDAHNKITNIESVILTPAKTSCPADTSENEKDTEKDEVTETNTSKNENSDNMELENVKGQDETQRNVESSDTGKTNTDLKPDTSKSSSAVYEAENGAVDEGDGIIINMEQSEIDCIISD